MLKSSLFMPSPYLGITLQQRLYILKWGILLEPGRECLELAQQCIQSLSDLPRGHRQPWLLPQFLYLHPDLAQLNPDSLQILKLLQGNSHPLITTTNKAWNRGGYILHLDHSTGCFDVSHPNRIRSSIYMFKNLHTSIGITTSFRLAWYELFTTTTFTDSTGE